MQLLLVSNNPYELTRPAAAGSRPSLESGQLGIAAVTITGAARAAELLTLETLRAAGRFSGLSQWSAATFEVEADNTVAAGIDGEAATIEPPLRFRIAPATLRVRLPATGPGLSPAALTPDPVHYASDSSGRSRADDRQRTRSARRARSGAPPIAS